MHPVLLVGCLLTFALTSLVAQGWSAPPGQSSKQQGSSRVWANYARDMEPQRIRRDRPPQAQPTDPDGLASWLDDIDTELVPAEEELSASVIENGSCHDCLSGSCINHQRSCQTWIQFDYLLGWRKGQRIPELVTTSDISVPPANAGILGLPTTSIVLGNQDLVDGARPGGRIDFGRWLANGETALAGRFYALSDSGTSHLFDATTHPVLAQPYFDFNTSLEAHILVNYPGVSTGSIQVTSSASLLGGDFYLRQSWCQIGSACVDLVTGYQFSQIDESLQIHSTHTRLVAPVGSLELTDQFDTRNRFHGGLLGIISQAEGSCWSLALLAKVGLGNTQQMVRIKGNRVVTALGGPPAPESRGLLTQDSNIGIHRKNEFAVVPELNVRYTRHLSERMDLGIGYTYIYWSRVVQPGDQISRIVDDTPNGTQPILNMVSNDYWMQSLNFGITWRF